MIERDLTPRQLMILQLLSEGEKTAKDMMSRLLSPVVISNIVEQLVQRGLITRRPCSNDRRRVILSLTEAGKATIQD